MLLADMETHDPLFELNTDHGVGVADLGIFLTLLHGAPGPSGLSCAGTTPCP